MSLDTDVCLYNLTLRHSDASLRSCVGNFSGKSKPEIITASSNRLTVYKIDSKQGLIAPVFSTQVFGIIRSITNFKVLRSGKDYLAITSDAGNLSILELDLTNEKFIPLFNEPYHKSGIRRLAPGADITANFSGIALCLSAIEKNKLVYMFNRDSDNNLIISSPLEANTSKVLTLTTVGLDTGYSNPQFASLEVDYAEYELQNEDAKEYQHRLTFYEVDMGLNHVVRKASNRIFSTANYLLPVPGGDDGPGGVVICSKNTLSYRNLQGDRLSVAIPKLQGHEHQDVQCVSGATHKLRNGEFFFLVQTQFGDIFKLELPPNRSLVITYFDTIPVCTSLVILNSGYLFADVERGDKMLYSFDKLGRDTNEGSVQVISESDIATHNAIFQRTELTCISPSDSIQCITPLLDSTLVTKDNSTSIYAISGVKDSASLKMLQYGLPITEVVSSPLPGIANRIWTTTLTRKDTLDRYMVISFIDTTLVLSIGDEVEEIERSGLAVNEETIGIQQIGRNSLAQVHPNGIRVVCDAEKVSEWQPPAGIKILTCSMTNRQIVVALSNNELVYFEVDEQDRLVEWNERKEMPARVTSMSLGEIPGGVIRAPFLVVGDQDSILRVFSTDPDSVLELVVMQSLSGVPTSIVQCFMDGEISVNIGLENGVFARTLLDSSGRLYDTRTKYLGNKPVVLSKMIKNGENVVLAFSNKTWAISNFKNFKINPVLVPPLRFGSSFNSEDCKDGVLGIHGRDLTIFTIDDFTNDISMKSCKLETTPKKLMSFDDTLLISESGEGNYIQKFQTSLIDQVEELEGALDPEKLTLDKGEKILTSAVVTFESSKVTYLLVSVVNGSAESYIHTYSMDLKLVHKTKLADVAYCMSPFQGKVLIGIKSQLRLFDMGMKQLLSKATSIMDTISIIVRIDTQGSRVAVGDIRESVTLLTYNSKMNEFIPFVDDVVSRHMTSLKLVDYNTVVGGDKFGNLFLLRCSDEVSKTGENSSMVLSKDKLYNGAPYKLDNVCHFFIQDIPMSFNKGAFTQGGRDVISYACIQGTVGVLIPLLTRSDIKFFKALERAMRLHVSSVIGRMHLQYRSFYQPVKNVIDGDFIETFSELSDELQEKVAGEVEKKISEIVAKIYDIRALSI